VRTFFSCKKVKGKGTVSR